MSRYIGFCYDTGAWGGDLSGILMREEEGGWVDVAGHISSGVGWSERDIAGHYVRRADPQPDDVYEWLGAMTSQAELDELERKYPPKKEAPVEG